MLQKKIKLSFKVCCYLQSQKVWTSIIQNDDMFQKKLLLLTDQISLKIIFKTFLLILGVTFLVPSQCSFPKLQLNVTKKYEIILFHCVSICISSKSVSQIFKILFHKLETVIFLSFVVTFIMSIICK